MSVYTTTTTLRYAHLSAWWQQANCERRERRGAIEVTARDVRVRDVTASPRPVAQLAVIDYVPLLQTSSSLIQFDT